MLADSARGADAKVLDYGTGWTWQKGWIEGSMADTYAIVYICVYLQTYIHTYTLILI